MLRYYLDISPKGLRKTLKNLKQDKQPPSRDTNAVQNNSAVLNPCLGFPQ
jgi:hypothetical protein